MISTKKNAAFRFTEEEMETAKGTDLPDLLEHLGYRVRRVGRYHTTREMDSIRIKDRRIWKRYDILCGTFFIAGVSGEHFVSLSDEQIQRYKELYDNIMVITAVKEQPHHEKSEQKKNGRNRHER